MTFNLKIFYWLHHLSHQNVVFDRMIVFFAENFDKILFGIALLFFVILFVLHKDWKHKGWIVWIHEGIIIGFSIFTAWFISFIIKSVTRIPRPFIAHGNVVPLFTHGGFDSFPSGHATIFFGLAMAVYLYHRKAGYFFFIGAALIAISRVIGGVHYPIDIIVGVIIGCVISKIVHTLLSNYFKNNSIQSV
jgi:membrane-associated phospholipid phosphatase